MMAEDMIKIKTAILFIFPSSSPHSFLALLNSKGYASQEKFGG